MPSPTQQKGGAIAVVCLFMACSVFLEESMVTYKLMHS